MKLNLGCGDMKMSGYINVDRCERVYPNVLHDLNIFPWPFETGRYSEILCLDIYEHVNEPVQFMEECWRLLVYDGIVHVRTSCWNTEQSFCDPTHKRFLTLESFDFFDVSTYAGKKYWWYTSKKFKIISKEQDCSELCFKLEKDFSNSDIPRR